MDDVRKTLRANLAASAEVQARLGELMEPLERATGLVLEALLGGRKLMCCGNGGSAGDAAHLSSEITNRYDADREGFAALDLTSDHNVLTALMNDYPPAEVFARQIRALGQPGDVVVVFTTSGNSENIVRAIETSRELGLSTIAFLGKGGGRCLGLADCELVVPSGVTARVQEAHLLLYHTLCEAMDGDLVAASRERSAVKPVSLPPKLG
ncbi:D-sedoheptulose-7-phosphate isomerase [Mucisphaera calidilacus]|uniref:Phosphoheptose isomerase n=1 Tax=Mucisphaera calidilacus TaxID=2527982 RepID=A0A518C0F9_9BACT|nr:SIS domain-containing protein [Mucisphaera calidilacus]QDU72699.1 Phosphoheptose isomerase [Mucisphaera calidilacus]